MITVTLYGRADCKLCDEAEANLQALQKEIPHHLTVVDIDSDPSLHDSYALEIPVVKVGTIFIKPPFTRQDLHRILISASDELNRSLLQQGGKNHKDVSQKQNINTADRFSYWMSKHYMAVFNLFLLMYVGFPFLAPVLKKIGWNGPAEVIYKVYSPLCHQWAFRSFFLFGEQPYYPHAETNMSGVLTFEQVSGITDVNDPGRLDARNFEGTPLLGYKVAICERDVAIWGAMALFGLIFAATGRKLPKMHWVIWVLVGCLPVGLDGFSQLISQIPNTFIQSLLPYRESTPLLRTLTGILFGFSTAWFMFPLLEETMAETRQSLTKKFAPPKVL